MGLKLDTLELDSLTADPSTPPNGCVWHRSDAKDLIVQLGGSKKTVRTIKDNLSATAAPGSGDDSGSGYAVGSLWIDTTGDKVHQCVDSTVDSAVWKELSAGGGKNDVVVAYAEGANPYIPKNLGASYDAQATVFFRGTTDLGTPSEIKVIRQASTGSPAHSIKIRDLTNSSDIAEKTGLTSTTLDILDMGTLSNLPTGGAVFQICVKRDDSGSASIDLYGICIGF